MEQPIGDPDDRVARPAVGATESEAAPGHARRRTKDRSRFAAGWWYRGRASLRGRDLAPLLHLPQDWSDFRRRAARVAKHTVLKRVRQAQDEP